MIDNDSCRSDIDRYLKVIARARKFYARNGWIIKSRGGIPSSYSNCSRLAYYKYIDRHTHGQL